MKESMQELMHIFEKYKDAKNMIDIIADIETVQEMIDEKDYDKETINEIESDYSIEIGFFINLEKEHDVFVDIKEEDDLLSALLNLRYRLYKLGTYRVLKENKKEITKEFISGNYKEFLKLICENNCE